MKKLGKLKLNVLSPESLSRREMNELKGGGDTCGCGCLYANNGGSDTIDNLNRNSTSGGLKSSSYQDAVDAGTTLEKNPDGSYSPRGGSYYHNCNGW